MKKAKDMTKEELIDYIDKAGCDMLKKIHFSSMTKDDIVKYLNLCGCPKIKKIV
jgi:hypothetical protein